MIKFFRREDAGSVGRILSRIFIQGSLSDSETEDLLELFDALDWSRWQHLRWYAIYDCMRPYITTDYMLVIAWYRLKFEM